MKSTEPPRLQRWEEAVAYVSLGVLCGWYYILCIAAPVLVYLAFRGSALTTTVLALLVGSAIMYVKGAFRGNGVLLSCASAESTAHRLRSVRVADTRPLSHKPWPAYMYSWIFRVWRGYFSFTFDVSGAFACCCDAVHSGAQNKR